MAHGHQGLDLYAVSFCDFNGSGVLGKRCLFIDIGQNLLRARFKTCEKPSEARLHHGLSLLIVIEFSLDKTAQAEAANYPFCTIEPNVGRVAVPDTRLEQLAAISKSATIIPTQLEFVDIAGLVRGASKGEGLGNQFLAHIRETDAVCYVLRCFEDDDITHVEGSVDPLRDAEIIETELIIADLESLEKRLPQLQKKAAQRDKEAAEILPLVEAIYKLLAEGKPARLATPSASDAAMLKAFKGLQLITAKPVFYIANVEEDSAVAGNSISAKVVEYAHAQHAPAVIISAKIEAELAGLESEAEKQEFLESLGLAESGLAQVIRAGYTVLDLQTFFTIGPKEAHAWTLRKGAKAPEAAGVIHTDFERGFIRAEVIGCADYITYKGESGAKDAGKFRLEGKEYLMQDGDVVHFRFNV
jgi:GTP-binding protein YchF